MVEQELKSRRFDNAGKPEEGGLARLSNSELRALDPREAHALWREAQHTLTRAAHTAHMRRRKAAQKWPYDRRRLLKAKFLKRLRATRKL